MRLLETGADTKYAQGRVLLPRTVMRRCSPSSGKRWGRLRRDLLDNPHVDEASSVCEEAGVTYPNEGVF
jgi:hypothetical protein